jgi:hypothetical protein
MYLAAPTFLQFLKDLKAATTNLWWLLEIKLV